MGMALTKAACCCFHQHRGHACCHVRQVQQGCPIDPGQLGETTARKLSFSLRPQLMLSFKLRRVEFANVFLLCCRFVGFLFWKLRAGQRSVEQKQVVVEVTAEIPQVSWAHATPIVGLCLYAK